MKKSENSSLGWRTETPPLRAPAVRRDLGDRPIRLCKDCRFSELQTTPSEKWVCRHPTSLFQPEHSLVTGMVSEPYQLSCADARSLEMGRECGRAARHWESRES